MVSEQKRTVKGWPQPSFVPLDTSRSPDATCWRARVQASGPIRMGVD